MSDETKCGRCGHLASLHFVNGKHPEQQPCWHKDGELFCPCEQLDPATPPTPDPRERGEFNADDATLVVRYGAAPRCESHVGVPFTKVKREHCVNCLAIAIKAALPAPAPSESVAEDDRALLFAAWLTTRPGVMTVGAGEHAGPMAEAVHEWRQAHPAPAPSEAVAWKVEERLKVGGPAYNTFWFGDDPERAARIRERAERHPHVSITPLYTHPAPAREVREDADFDAADALANHWSRPGAWPEQANIAHAYLVLRRGIVK